MTNDANNIMGRAIVALVTLLFSATMVLSAVGPAVGSADAGQQIAGLANVPGKSANSLA